LCKLPVTQKFHNSFAEENQVKVSIPKYITFEIIGTLDIVGCPVLKRRRVVIEFGLTELHTANFGFKR
jgi:hypothetical protein